MKPSTLKPGDKILYRGFFGDEEVAYFVWREPARGKGCPAKNHLRFPTYAGQNGAGDNGTTVVGDYDLARRGRLASEASA